MKRYLKISFWVVLAMAFVACTPEDDTFDESLLYGTWLNQDVSDAKQEYYKYFENGTGYTWDEADDVTEEEAQAFRWTLTKSDFTHVHIMEIGSETPTHYKMQKLTSTTLKYKDDFDSYTFTRVR